MQNGFSMRSLCGLGLLWLAIGPLPSSAEDTGPLARCLYDGPGEPDACETVSCRVEACKRAAENGHAKAVVLTGMAHVHGKGVQEDYVAAYMYFRVLGLMSAPCCLSRKSVRDFSDYFWSSESRFVTLLRLCRTSQGQRGLRGAHAPALRWWR